MGFQFKPELVDKITNGPKRQTRRPVREGDYTVAFDSILYRNNRKLWAIGQQYAIQPGRGKKGVGFLKVTNIRCEDVRNISHEDAVAEGFESQLDFLAVWIGFYDKGIWLNRTEYPTREMQIGDWYMHCTERDQKWHQDSATESFIWDHIRERPAELYQAWAISFELVKAAEAVQS